MLYSIPLMAVAAAELFRTGKVVRKIPQECSKTRDGGTEGGGRAVGPARQIGEGREGRKVILFTALSPSLPLSLLCSGRKGNERELSLGLARVSAAIVPLQGG